MNLIALIASAWGRPADMPDLWSQMLQGRLAQSMNEDPAESVEIYTALLRDLSSSHPLYGELMYWLGRAQYAHGDSGSARSSLMEAREDPAIREEADSFLREMGAWEHRVRSLPYAGRPWVGPLGQHPPKDTWELLAVLDIEASQPTEILLQLHLDQASSMVLTLRDWEGGSWLWQEQLGAGEQSVLVPVSALQPPEASSTPRFRSLSFRVQGLLPGSEPHWDAQVRLR